jgi:hypothetical protein
MHPEISDIRSYHIPSRKIPRPLHSGARSVCGGEYSELRNLTGVTAIDEEPKSTCMLGRTANGDDQTVVWMISCCHFAVTSEVGAVVHLRNWTNQNEPQLLARAPASFLTRFGMH